MIWQQEPAARASSQKWPDHLNWRQSMVQQCYANGIEPVAQVLRKLDLRGAKVIACQDMMMTISRVATRQFLPGRRVHLTPPNHGKDGDADEKRRRPKLVESPVLL